MASKYQFTMAALLGFAAAQEIAPIAIFHGISDSCDGLSWWVDRICAAVPEGTPCKCVEIGGGYWASLFEKMDWQVATGCRKIKNDPDFAGKEINVIGFSQGGLIARSVVERCDDLTVDTLFTWGGPHQGVSEIPDTHGHWWSIPLNLITGRLAEWALAQNLIAPAGFFRPWWNLQNFFENSQFLPYINNELPPYYAVNQTNNLKSVNKFALWKWTEDLVIIPRESSWFAGYDSYHHLVELRDSLDYKEDFIGMKTLDEAGKLWFYSGPGDHMALQQYFIDDYLIPMLDNTQTPPPSEY